nr:hypothetical protein [Paenibacillus tianmuensis]
MKKSLSLMMILMLALSMLLERAIQEAPAPMRASVRKAKSSRFIPRWKTIRSKNIWRRIKRSTLT